MAKPLVLILLVFTSIVAPAQDTLIYRGSEWKYYDLDKSPVFYWFSNEYDDSDWKTGKTPMGYGEDEDVTSLNYGDDPNVKKLTQYFRKTISIENPQAYLVYLLKLKRDDGAVVYLNGREVWRTNMPAGIINDTTRALKTVSGNEENQFFEYIISADYFEKGENLIAISLHQSRPWTSDCTFDFELIRHNDLFSVNQQLRDQKEGEQVLNRSFSFLSLQLEIENKNNEIKHLTIKNNNLQNYSLLIAVLFVLLLIVVFVIIIRNIKKSHKEENKIRNLEIDLNQKNQEIINYALNVVKHKQFLKQVKDELSSIHYKNDRPKEIEAILSKIAYYDDHEDEWERMKVHFDNVHSGFFSRLKEKYPGLTQAELQHCSYIKLQLPTKEIARMLNIDPKSVQASRYRIKKKMDLDVESDLREIIGSF